MSRTVKQIKDEIKGWESTGNMYIIHKLKKELRETIANPKFNDIPITEDTPFKIEVEKENVPDEEIKVKEKKTGFFEKVNETVKDFVDDGKLNKSNKRGRPRKVRRQNSNGRMS